MNHIVADIDIEVNKIALDTTHVRSGSEYV